MNKLSDGQFTTLVHLAKCKRMTRNNYRSTQGREPTSTLRSLERLGLVECKAPRSIMSANVTWAITPAGLAEAAQV